MYARTVSFRAAGGEAFRQRLRARTRQVDYANVRQPPDRSDRLQVGAGLLKVNAIARALECDFARFTATLRADASMYGRTEALFLADATDGTGQVLFS